MCDCPDDWVACFKQGCERAAVIREQLKRGNEEARRVALSRGYERHPKLAEK